MQDKQPIKADDAAVSEAARPSSRAEQGERSRELILDAAIHFFAERGYDGTSLDDISALSDFKRSLILYHYRSKDELWRAAAERVANTFRQTVRRKLARVKTTDPREALSSTLEAWIDAFIEASEFPKFLVREGGVHGPRLEFLVQNFEFSEVLHGTDHLRAQMKSTILRDTFLAIHLAMAALGPLMEATMVQISGKRKAGIHPLSKKARRELIGYIMKFLSAVDPEGPAAGE